MGTDALLLRPLACSGRRSPTLVPRCARFILVGPCFISFRATLMLRNCRLRLPLLLYIHYVGVRIVVLGHTLADILLGHL